MEVFRIAWWIATRKLSVERAIRRKALVISLCFEAVVLAAMLTWPLITPGVLPAMGIVTPLPPYHGGGIPTASRTPQSRSHVTHAMSQFVFRPTQPSIPARDVPDNFAPEIRPGPIGNSDPGFGPGPVGPFIPGASDNGKPLAPPHESPAANAPVRQKMSEGVMAGALIHRVDPVYPTIARAMHLSGEVRLRAIIATDGTVQNLEVLSGSPILARAAQDAVRQWRYRPTLLNGVPVEVETYVTVNFVLGQ